MVDFYCNEPKPAIESDGNFHSETEGKEYDKSRTALLNELSFKVLE